MSYFSRKVDVPKPLQGEYVVTIKEHMDMSDEKGNRYLIQLSIENRTYDYYIFPKPDDYKFDEEQKKLKTTQINYLLEVFAPIQVFGRLQKSLLADKRALNPCFARSVTLHRQELLMLRSTVFQNGSRNPMLPVHKAEFTLEPARSVTNPKKKHPLPLVTHLRLGPLL